MPTLAPVQYKLVRAGGVFLWSMAIQYVLLEALIFVFQAFTNRISFQDLIEAAPVFAIYSLAPAGLSLAFPIPKGDKLD